ncbi:MAG: YezD family protein [Candidatus Methylomirabilales bacterium]
MNTEAHQSRGPDLSEEGDIVRQIIDAIRSVRFGQVQIIIQDSRVVQIDKTEKVRLA